MFSQYNLILSKSDTAILREKVSKLYGAARMLNLYLKGDFDSILSDLKAQYLSRNQKILILNKKLTDFTDLVAKCFPPLGVGYYSKELDAIITYGPSKNFGYHVGKSIPKDHLGREVMEKKKEMIITGDMVRGNCMACFLPIVRKSKAIGYVWATEPVQEIYEQIREATQKKSILTNFKMEMDILPLLFNNPLSDLIKPKYKEIIKDIPWNSSSLLNTLDKDILIFFRNVLSYLESIKDYSQNILENINYALIIIDLEGKVLFFNKAAYWLFKKKKEKDILDNFYFNVLIGTGELGLKNIVDEVIKTEKTFLKYEVNYPGFDDKKIINMSVSILRDINRNKIGLIIVIEDISDEKKTEQEKIKERKLSAFGELANSLAHEISNPLAAIKALVQLLPEKLEDKKFVNKFVKEVTKEVERIDKIFKNLFTLIQSPRNDFKNINLNNIISEVLFSVEGMAEKNHINIIRRFKRNLPEITADPNQLKQVFLNIIINAFHAMPTGGFLKVFTEYDYKNNFIKVKFVDNGCGVSKNILDRVFEPFFTTKEDGSGIGLSVSYNIVRQHGGFIQLESEGKKGSIFTIVLPYTAGVKVVDIEK